MNSKKAKGDKAENEVANILLKDGFIVEKAQRTFKPYFSKGQMRYTSQANDFFGLFDLIAKFKRHTYWIQVKSNPTHVYEVKPKIEKFFNSNCNMANETCEIWLRVARKGFVIFTFVRASGWNKSFINLKGDVVEPFTYS